jgi:hypothetical protein
MTQLDPIRKRIGDVVKREILTRSPVVTPDSGDHLDYLRATHVWFLTDQGSRGSAGIEQCLRLCGLYASPKLGLQKS